MGIFLFLRKKQIYGFSYQKNTQICPMSKTKISLKEINALAIPAIFAGIIEPLISLTDTAVAGHLLTNTSAALGAIGLVGSFLSALIWVFVQTSSALSALVSHGVGENRIFRLKKLVSQIFFINLGIGILLGIGSFFLSHEILRLYGAKAELLQAANTYMRIRVMGFPLTLLTLTVFGIFRGLQNTRWAMWIGLVGGGANIGLDLFCVYVLKMDIEGIAIASVFAQFVMFIMSFIILIKKTPFKIRFSWKSHPLLGKTLGMSLNLFLRTLSLNLALFLAFRFATLLGNQSVAAHTLLVQVWLFSSYLLDGYATAGRAIAGKLFGANDLPTLNRLVKDLVKIMLGIGMVLGVFYGLLEKPIGTMLTKSTDVLSVFYSVFWLVALMQPINALAFMMDGIYKGLGKTKTLRNVFVVAVLLGFIPPLILFYQLGWGLTGIWLAFFVWMLFRAGGMSLDYYKNYLQKEQF